MDIQGGCSRRMGIIYLGLVSSSSVRLDQKLQTPAEAEGDEDNDDPRSKGTKALSWLEAAMCVCALRSFGGKKGDG